jgi:hypothetical protein
MIKIAGSASESYPGTDGNRKKFTNTVSFLFQTTVPTYSRLGICKSVFQIHMFLGLPDPDPPVRCIDPDPFINKQK